MPSSTLRRELNVARMVSINAVDAGSEEQSLEVVANEGARLGDVGHQRLYVLVT